MSLEIVVARYDKNGFPVSLSEQNPETSYFFCGRDDFSAAIGHYIYGVWSQPTEEQEEEAEEFAHEMSDRYAKYLASQGKDPNEAKHDDEFGILEDDNLSCPHVTFAFSPSSTIDKASPDCLCEHGMLPSEVILPLSSLTWFIDHVVDKARHDKEEEYHTNTKIIETGWKAAANATSLESFLEFVDFLKQMEETFSEECVLSSPPYELSNILNNIIYELGRIDDWSDEDFGFIRIFYSE